MDCSGVGIGRQEGLKIPCPVMGVRVRSPSGAQRQERGWPSVHSSEILYEKSTLDFISSSMTPPSSLTSNLAVVRDRAFFCFWTTTIVRTSLSQRSSMVAFLSSKFVFSAAVITIFCVPASPEVGEIEHHESALPLTISAVQAVVALKTIETLPPFAGKNRSQNFSFRNIDFTDNLR